MSLPAALLAGWPFYRRGVQSVINRSANMWTWIGLGTSVAFVYSVVATVAPQTSPPAFVTECLPAELDGAAGSVRPIDVVWLEAGGRRVVAAFEVEHSTSIYSGIVRMLDLALGSAVAAGTTMFLVAPDDRRDEVAQQLRRPAFSCVSELDIRYLPYGILRSHRTAISRFGKGLKPLPEISQTI